MRDSEKNISENITDVNRRKAFGRTLYGVNDSKAIEGWVQDNADGLIDAQNGDQALDLVWPLITEHVHNKGFNKFDKKDVDKLSSIDRLAEPAEELNTSQISHASEQSNASAGMVEEKKKKLH